ncbi:MAG: deaminase, partial [Clostridium sp.]|nr:deaminase [Clostridium sp.]
TNLYGAKIYVALFPCNECAKAIIQAGIKEVVYLSDKYSDSDNVKASKRLLSASGVKMRILEPKNKNINISLDINDI